MSQENVEIVRAVYARWARGDLSASLSLFDGDVALVVDAAIPDGGTYLGPDGVRKYMSRFLDPWESLSIAGEAFKQVGDTVLVAVRQSGIGRASGAPVEHRYFQLWTFRDGRVTRLEVILSEQQALEAVGLPEEAMSQENVEIVRRVVDVMDAEGFEAALPVFLDAAHSDVEWREDPAWPGSASYRGVEQVRQVILDRMDTLDFDQQTEDLMSVDDKVVSLVRWIGRGKTSGAQGEISMAMVWTVRDQAITRIEFFLDRAQALAAVGLSE